MHHNQLPGSPGQGQGHSSYAKYRISTTNHTTATLYKVFKYYVRITAPRQSGAQKTGLMLGGLEELELLNIASNIHS